VGRTGLALVLALSSCRPSSPTPAPARNESREPVILPTPSAEPVPPEPTASPEPDAGNEFEATLRIDKKPGGKKFQGVWLERDGGSKWVISYRPEPLWRSFEGQRVRVRGTTYQPPGQAINATHFRVERLVLAAGDAQANQVIVEVGAESTYTGVFREHSWPAGSKLAGEKTRVFVSGTESWFLQNSVDGVELDKNAVVVAREVVLSPYVARPGGRFLWILETRWVK
jgi:hypothetical protein